MIPLFDLLEIKDENLVVTLRNSSSVETRGGGVDNTGTTCNASSVDKKSGEVIVTKI